MAIARNMIKDGYSSLCFEYLIKKKSSEDFLINKKRLKLKTKTLNFSSIKKLILDKKHIIIDSIIGSGLNRPLDDHLKEIYKVRVDNGQNRIFVLFLLFLKYSKYNLKKILKL